MLLSLITLLTVLSVDSIVLENKETHIIGDFNIISLLSDASSDSRKLIGLMENQSFYQMQKNATRVAENSSTLIDHHYNHLQATVNRTFKTF